MSKNMHRKKSVYFLVTCLSNWTEPRITLHREPPVCTDTDQQAAAVLQYSVTPDCLLLFSWCLVVPSDAVCRPHDCVCYCVEFRSQLDLLVQTVLFLFCPHPAGQVRFDHKIQRQTASQLTDE